MKESKCWEEVEAQVQAQEERGAVEQADLEQMPPEPSMVLQLVPEVLQPSNGPTSHLDILLQSGPSPRSCSR